MVDGDTNLPAWLVRNPVFRWLYLFRKLYLTPRSLPHHAQFAEDISIGRLLPRELHDGFFVDVGCFHPFKFNNTWALYKKGWRGINVDIDSIKIAAFDLVRPHDTNVACAVSSSEGEITYYSSGFYSCVVTLDEEFAANKKAYDYVEKKCRCATLTTIIDETKYRDRKIDFLSVDVEGHDYEVLKSLDFERYAPRLVAVEIHEPLLAGVCETELYKFLSERGYGLVGWCGLTLLMASRELQTALADEVR